MRVIFDKVNPDTSINYYIAGAQSPTGIQYNLDPIDTPNLITLESREIGAQGFATIVLSFWQGPIFPYNPTAFTDFTFNFFGSVYTASADPERNQFFTWTEHINSRILSAQSLVDQINTDININWRYNAVVDLSSTTVFIRLKAKNYGTQFDPLQNDSEFFSLSSNGVVLNNNTYTFGHSAGSDRYLGQILSPFNGSYFVDIIEVPNLPWGRRGNKESDNNQLITTLEASWNSSNEITFDISSYLRPLVEIPIPDYGNLSVSSISSITDNPIAAYFLRYGEKFNGGYSNYGLSNPNGVIDGLEITFPSFNQFNSSTGSFQFNDVTYSVNTEYDYAISQSSQPYYITVFVSTIGVVQRIIGLPGVTQPLDEPNGTFLLGYIYVPAGDLSASNYPKFEYPYGPSNTSDNITNTYTRRYITGESEIYWCARGAFTGNFNPSNFIQYYQSVVPFSATVNDYIPVKFCTNQPNQYKVRRRDVVSEYLYFYHLNDHQFDPSFDLQLASEFRAIDGSVYPIHYSNPANSVSHSGLFFVDLNLNYIGFFQYNSILPILDSKHWIEKFTNGAWERITDYQYYEYDQNTETTYYPIVFRNSFGCFDIFQFDGTQSETINTNPLVYTQTIQSQTGWIPSQKYKGVYDANPTIQLTLNSGWVDLNHYRWLQELLSSTDVLIPEKYILLIFAGTPINTWLTSISDRLTQCNIVSFNWQADDRTKLFNLEITLEASLPKNSITD